MGSNLDPIKNELQRLISKHQAPIFLVAVSGGLDSMLLLHLLHELGARVHAMHINYRLRQHESDLDAKMVEAYCTSKKIPLHLYSVTDAEQSELKSANLQAKARNLRYTYFEQISACFSQSLICTAHHADDQIETFWLQLSRGAGMKGLAGMPTLNKNRLRPFLSFSKQDLYKAAKEINLHWREDQSNKNLAYRRNIWRNQLLPELIAALPDLKPSIQLIQKNFQTEIVSQQEVLDFAIEKLENNQTITLREISLLSAYQFIELFKYFKIPTHIIQRIPELFKAENGKKSTWKNSAGMPNALVIFDDALWLIHQDVDKIKTICPFYFDLTQTLQLPPSFNLNEVYLDAQLLKGELQFRPLQKNDFMYPVGLKGKKSAFEILKEHKIPSLLRANHWGLFDQEKLVLIPGIKLDGRALANQSSAEILKVSLYKKT